VFDKVRENTAPILGTRKSTYSQAANLALNQTLVRSINTSLIALLPVTAILIIGTLQTGNGELKDLALVLFVGMLSGTYSSICIATPVLADLKERDPQYKQLAKQVAQRAAGGRAAIRKARQAAVAGATAGNGNGNGAATAVSLGDPELDGEAPDAEPEAAPGDIRIPGQGAQSVREVGQRQQPTRRPGATNRRPSGKKKRR